MRWWRYVLALVSAACVVVAAALYECPAWQLLGLVPIVGTVLIEVLAPISTDDRLQRLVQLVERRADALPAWFGRRRGGRRLVGTTEWQILKRLAKDGPSTAYDLSQASPFRSVELEVPIATLSRHVLIEQAGIDGGGVVDDSGGLVWGPTPLGGRCVEATANLRQ